MTLFKHYLGKHSLRVTVEIILKFLGTLGDLFIPLILATIIDDIAPLNDIPLLLLWGLLMLLVSVITLCLNRTANAQAAWIAKSTSEEVRKDLFDQIMNLSARQIDKLTISSLETRLTSDTYNIQQVIAMMLRIGLRAPILLIGGIVTSFLLDPVLTMILVAIVPIICMTVYILSKRGILLYRTMQKSEDELVGLIRENITGIRIIKALSTTSHEVFKFADRNDMLTDNDIEATINMVKSNPLITLFLNLGSVLVIYLGAYRYLSGYCDLGDILAIVTYFTVIANALITLSRIVIMATKGLASANRIQEVLDYDHDFIISSEDAVATTDETAHSNSDTVGSTESMPHISFHHVSFSYNIPDALEDSNQEQNLHIHNVSFQLGAGQTLGIIGPTGSGKSTLLLLLMRFYDINHGCIRINGADITTLDAATLHQMFGVVFQSDHLFHDTIAENISFGRNLPLEEIKRAAQIAQASNFIESYEDTYEYQLAIKGSNLSGGQKQRLLIARAVANAPQILILDDSSSALDYKTDAALRQELRNTYTDTTTIIVAQRVSAIAHADLILVLEDGEVIGQGTHPELLQNCPWYYELSKHQLDL